MKDDRRSFLKKLVLGSAAAVAVSAARPGKAAARGRKTGDGEILYRETPAFREYYRSLKS
jgi:hypothetical protein